MAAYAHNPDLLKRYLELDQGGKVQAECKSHLLLTILSSVRSPGLQPTNTLSTDVWIDGDGGLRCKTTVSPPAFAPKRHTTRFHVGNVAS